MNKIIILVVFMFVLQSSYAQYDNFFRSIIRPTDLFKPVKGEFIPKESKTIIADRKTRKANYSYQFNNKSVKIEFFYPQSLKDSSCSYFEVEGKRINLKNNFEADFACELDVTSFKVYKGSFGGRNYLLLTCINTGSGTSTTSVICNLFDITDKKSIQYYPLWSKYGSSSCFGDFNHDGLLDFLKIRNYKGERDSLKVELTSLQKGIFCLFKSNKYYLILNLDNDIIRAVKRNWL